MLYNLYSIILYNLFIFTNILYLSYLNNFIIYKSDLSDQSIVKKDLGKILEKIEEITISVCKQCGNNFLPSVSNCSSLEDAIRQIDSDNKIYIFDTEASDYFPNFDNKYKMGMRSRKYQHPLWCRSLG